MEIKLHAKWSSKIDWRYDNLFTISSILTYDDINGNVVLSHTTGQSADSISANILTIGKTYKIKAKFTNNDGSSANWAISCNGYSSIFNDEDVGGYWYAAIFTAYSNTLNLYCWEYTSTGIYD
ncbi:MAG: hypothetical protein ACD_33C00021G0001, partial [uncultured bacterium]